MRAKSAEKRKVHIVTLGCSKNQSDSEDLASALAASGFEVKHAEIGEEEQIVIINTCGFIESAKEQSINTILHYEELKKEGIIKKLYVSGCLSERYKDVLKKNIPGVDAFFGTRDLPLILKTLKADYKKELVGERLISTPKHYAYLKISEGCDRPCSFCAIPLMRGNHVSVPMEDLLSRAEKLSAQGVKELLIIAQDSTYYGLDLYGKRKLAELLDRLSDVQGISWIRLHYAFPGGFPMDVLDVMKRKNNICKYLDMPLQHINDTILKSMRRGITKEKTIRLLEEIRNKIPDITLRTTLISGYPGETQAMHEELLEFVENTKFDRLGVFTYSHEENTHAFSLNNDVPDEIKKQRVSEIMETQRIIALRKNEEKIGKTLRVIIDRKEKDYYIGRTEADSPDVDQEVLIHSDQELKIGNFYMVKIKNAMEYDLTGEEVLEY
ncbi:MAG: 30S ribosomal protein S12 methylthiotransferase RimO [Bacteroidia bacterium]|nr:30S ribosomal protein S12 methylthiotransferase RimO [Bacteroidia bacterium]